MSTFRNRKDTRIYETAMTVLAFKKQKDHNLSHKLVENLTKE